MQRNAPISGYPVTGPIASNRDRGHVRPLIQVYSCTIKVMLTIGTKMALYWELCLIEHVVLMVFILWSHFFDECDNLRTLFSLLKYPKHLVNFTIKRFVDSKVSDQQQLSSPSQETDACRDSSNFTIWRPDLSTEILWGNNVKNWA